MHKYLKILFFTLATIVTSISAITASSVGIQPFKHQGKERLNFEDMNVHDHGARWAFNAIGRWLSPDPLAETNYAVSPYAYCNNNPVRFTDPDGRMTADWMDF